MIAEECTFLAFLPSLCKNTVCVVRPLNRQRPSRWDVLNFQIIWTVETGQAKPLDKVADGDHLKLKTNKVIEKRNRPSIYANSDLTVFSFHYLSMTIHLTVKSNHNPRLLELYAPPYFSKNRLPFMFWFEFPLILWVRVANSNQTHLKCTYFKETKPYN